MIPIRPAALPAALSVPLAFVLIVLPVQASPTMAVISGVVADSAGTPIPGAGVILTAEGFGTSRVTTDSHGRYRFPGVAPLHLCSVAAERSGFRSVTYAGVLTEAGRTRVVNFRLKRPDERDIVIVVSRDPFPYEDFVRGFTGHVGAPVRVVDLDREPDPADAVRRIRAERPNLIVGAGLRAARQIRREAPDVPAILTLVTDPRRHDLLTQSLGFLMIQPDADQLFGRVAEVLPGLKRIGMVYQADTGWLLARDLRDAAERRGLWVEFGLCRSDRDIRPALDVMRGRIDGLVVPNDDLTSIPRAQDIITAWALENHVPLAVSSPEWVERGALLSYGASYARLGEETSSLAARVLEGVMQPADLSVLRSKEFELTVNRATAARIGVTIPSGLKVDALY